jgi:hypothetical protein
VTPRLNPAKNGGWRVTGVPKSCSMFATCSHVSDVYHALSCPRVRLEAAMTAALHQLSQDVYSRTQTAGGLRLFRLRTIMLEYRASLHRFATQAHSLFSDIKHEANSYFPAAQGGAPAAAGVPALVAVRGAPKKTAASCLS